MPDPAFASPRAALSGDLHAQLSATLGAAYRVENELVGGGMSRVYTAQDLTLGRTIVIKVLPPELCGMMNVERFKREIHVAARLQHPHIVPLLSTGEIDGMPYFTMPFVKGESLRQHIRREVTMSVPEAVAVLRDVSKALAYAHEHGIVHRDVKPDNVMLTGGSACVTDFGIAKAISASLDATGSPNLTIVGTSLGTPPYIAPEQAAADPCVDHRADLYSLGCMAYEMLTGRPPFIAASVHKLFAAHLAQLPQPVTDLRPDTPAALADLVMQCLEKEPDQRPASASEILQQLNMITSGGNPSLRLTPSSGPQSRYSTPARLTPAPSHVGQRRLARLLSTRVGLTGLALAVVLINLLETAADESVAQLVGVASYRDSIARVLLSLEWFVSFSGHDVTNRAGVYLAATAYFFVFPALLLSVGLALARCRSVIPFRVGVVAVSIDYLISLPFFLFFPVVERWSVPQTGAVMLSNQLSMRLIEVARPMSGLDNCFPSFHTSLTVIAVTVAFAYRLRFRYVALWCGVAVLLSTFMLGIHWLPDIVAGACVGLIALALAIRLERVWNRVLCGPRTTPSLRATVAVAAVAVISICAPSPVQAQDALTFSSVTLDADTRQADDRLRRYLESTAGVTFVAQDAAEHDIVVQYLATRKPTDGNYIARVTPYVLVAAELLGAQVQVIGTYVSRATSATTYRAYFVVQRDAFGREPELEDIARMIRRKGGSATFAYHNRFSSSSYFLPAIFFRGSHIYDMPAPTETAGAIRAREISGESSDLVKAVADRSFDIAAVWSGTKATFENTPTLAGYASRVYFVPLPDELPNDLLIAGRSIDSATVGRIRRALGGMSPRAIDVGDYVTWRSIDEAPEARDALANLRWLARAAPAPVTVDVQRGQGAGRDIPDVYLAAARQAVRLAGLEFVNFDRDYHRQQDYVLTMSPANDGTILLRSSIVGSDAYDQEFQLTFRDTDELLARITEVLHTRVHRIRYLWPYRATPPTVLRDMNLELRPGTPVSVRKIRWLDARRHSYQQDEEFEATIAKADLDKVELAPSFVTPPDARGFGFSPMSNVSYRVILPRLTEERALFRMLTIILLAVFIAGMIAAVVAIRRAAAAGDFTYDIPES